MILEPLKQDDPRLRRACAKIAPRDLALKTAQDEIEAMLDFVYQRTAQRLEHEAGQEPMTVGLSANQLGIMKQICIVDFAIAKRGYHDVQVLVNPEITWQSNQLIERVEGCVNFPSWWGITRRPARVKIKALSRSGAQMEWDVSGWAAAVVCHEVDHLSGRLFIDRLCDPEHAHLVEEGDYPAYRRMRKIQWPKTIDVRDQIVVAGSQ